MLRPWGDLFELPLPWDMQNQQAIKFIESERDSFIVINNYLIIDNYYINY